MTTTMTNDSMLQRTYAKFTAVGSVYEMSSRVQDRNGKWVNVPMEIMETTRDEYVDGKPSGKKIKCQRLNGTIVLKTSDGLLDFNINMYDKTSAGKENKKWDMAVKMMDWLPEVSSKEEHKIRLKNKEKPTYVTMSGRLGSYDSVGKDGNVYQHLQWNVDSKCHHIDEAVASGCSVTSGAFFLENKTMETVPKGDERVESGRLIFHLHAIDDNGGCYPVDTILEKEFVEGVMEAEDYANRTTQECQFDRIQHHIGIVKKTNTHTFGKTKVEAVDGYDVEELILRQADIIKAPESEFTQGDEGNNIPVKTKYLNPDAMDKAFDMRKMKLEQLVKDKNKKPSGSELSNAKSKFGTAKVHVEEPVGGDDDEDLDW